MNNENNNIIINGWLTYSNSGSPSLNSITEEVVENLNSERRGDVVYVSLNALWRCPVTHGVDFVSVIEK